MIVTFLECRLGYRGTNCTTMCKAGYFGRLCATKCNCPHDFGCHHVCGCVNAPFINATTPETCDGMTDNTASMTGSYTTQPILNCSKNVKDKLISH